MAWLSSLLALVSSAVVARSMLPVGRRLDVVDYPDDELKTHEGAPVPLGGIALMSGLHLGMVVAGVFDLGLFLSTLVVLIVGLIDDIRGLTPLFRLASTTAAGIVLVLASNLTEGLLPGLAVVALVVVGVNAVNLFDGLDALASTVGALGFVGLAAFGWVLSASLPWLPLIAAGALVGVLTLNWPPARLYLGDNGAYVVGVALVWAGVRAAPDWGTGLVGAALIGVPLLDLGGTVFRRLRRGQPIFSGDRYHIYDRLHHRLGSTVAVVGVVALAQVAWCALVVATLWVWGAGAAIMAALVAGLIVVVVSARS